MNSSLLFTVLIMLTAFGDLVVRVHFGSTFKLGFSSSGTQSEFRFVQLTDFYVCSTTVRLCLSQRKSYYNTAANADAGSQIHSRLERQSRNASNLRGIRRDMERQARWDGKTKLICWGGEGQELTVRESEKSQSLILTSTCGWLPECLLIVSCGWCVS